MSRRRAKGDHGAPWDDPSYRARAFAGVCVIIALEVVAVCAYAPRGLAIFCIGLAVFAIAGAAAAIGSDN